MYKGKFEVFESIIQEIMTVYKHDERPWLIGYSGGKDSTLLVSLVYEAIKRLKLAESKLSKKIYVITSDTMVENPIVKKYMHFSSESINRAADKNHDDLPIEAHIIYPEPEQTFWSRIIGLGYPTPEPPGFRWCTDRLKIMPMNKFVNDRIKENGQIVILLGVRKGESTTRLKTITAREIEGKLLNLHNDIPNAYVYNPITEVPNELVWEFLLKDKCVSPWGTDMKYLFNLYQGENMGEEQSVLGEVDRDKIPVTGNSRFGCWCCTMVKEDKSLQNFINKSTGDEVRILTALRDFRYWLLEIRESRIYRDNKRRNGSVYKKADGSFGLGPFTLEARKMILKRLLMLESEIGLELITMDELKVIDKMWDEEGDLSCRSLVNIYAEAKNKKLPWDEYKTPRFDAESIDAIERIAKKYNLPFELITKLIVSVDGNKNITRNNRMQKMFDQIVGQGWLHYDAVEGVLDNEN
jgi:putative sulfurtransferase DndC